jgi:hypothetical protein
LQISAVEYLRILSAMDGTGPSVLNRATINAMLGANGNYVSDARTVYYGFGFFVRPGAQGRQIFWHTGNKGPRYGGRPGVAIAVRSDLGVNWVAIFPERPDVLPNSAINGDLWTVMRSIQRWPTVDLRSQL